MRDDVRYKRFVERKAGGYVDWLELMVMPHREALDEIYRTRVMELRETPTGYVFDVDRVAFRKASEAVKLFIGGAVAGGDSSGLLMIHMLSAMVGEGMKVFRPTAHQCEAMEQIDPRFPCEDYRQPFPTMMIELPADYSDNRLVHGQGFRSSKTEEVPLAILVRHECNSILLMVVLRAEVHLTMKIDLKDGCLVSDKIVLKQVNHDDEAYDLNDQESDLIHRACLIAINACSLLVDHGCRRLPDDDQREKKRLQYELREAKRKNVGIGPADLALRCHPVVYGFEQTIVLHETEEAPAEATGVGGWTVRPHWRIGCWASQPFGPHREQRKRIFRPPVLVNQHLLRGPLSNTTVNISTDWRERR